MKKYNYGRRLLLSLGALSMALGQAAILPDTAITPIFAEEAEEAEEFVIPETAKEKGTWGTAKYYLDNTDGTLYFGPGKAENRSMKIALGSYVKRIVSSPDFDTSAVTTLYDFFGGYELLEDISGLASWDVSNVTNMVMFLSQTKIKNLDALSSWNTESLTNMTSMFWKCTELTDISGLENWDTGKLSEMSGVFKDCTSLTSLSGLENWNTTSLKNLTNAFANIPLTDISPLQNWQTPSLTQTGHTFNGTRISDVSPLGGWNMSKNASVVSMFSNIPNLTSLKGLEDWDLSTCTSFSGMFTGSNNLSDVSAIATWKTHPTKWLKMTGFLDIPSIEKVDLSLWNLANANVNKKAPEIFSFRPIAIKLSSSYLAASDDNKTKLIDGNGIPYGLTGAAANLSEYMSADLAHGPMNSTDLLAGWQDDWAGWWGLATDVTLNDGQGNSKTQKMPMLCDVTVPTDAFTREGYALTGWTDAAGNTYDAAHPYSVTKEANQQLTAVWEKQFTIPETAEEIGKWGTAPYYLDETDGTLYFGPGSTGPDPMKFYLDGSVKRIVSSPEFDTSELTSLYEVFSNYSLLEDISGLASWDVSKVTDLCMFLSRTKVANLDALRGWNTESLTNMTSTFSECPELNDISGLENWKTSKLTEMGGTFQACPKLTSLNGLEKWDVSSLKNMSSAFEGTPLSDISALRDWTTTKLSNTCQTFNGARFSDASPLGSWNMNRNSGPAGMFANNPNLTSLNGLENWDLSSGWYLTGMFSGCENLSDVSAIATWKINPPLGYTLEGFLDVPKIEKVDLSTWDLSSSNEGNSSPNIYSFRPIAIKLSSQYLSTKDDNKTKLIDGNGVPYGLTGAAANLNEYMSADLVHGPMTSTEILAGWQDDWAGWWGLATDVTLNDGQGHTKTQKMPMLCDVTVPTENVFTRRGYVLSGWRDTSGNVYDAENPYPVTKAASQTLTAVWTESDDARTVVTFNANGGTGSMDPQTVLEASNLNENTFTRTKYEFTGWNTSADGSGTAYANKAAIDVLEGQSALTLYAQWRYLPSTTTISFNANGGTGSMDSVTATEGTEMNLPENTLSRSHYEFNGWNTKANGSGTAYANKAAFTAGNTDASITLYAQWKYVYATTTISFDANGGAGTMANLSVKEGTPKNLSANSFTRDGWTFKGWNTKADGSGTAYANGASYIASDRTETVILYAQWEKSLDLRTLQAAVNFGKDLNLEGFTSESKEAFQKKLAASQMVLARPKDQDDVDKAAQELNLALLNLRYVPNSEKLEDLGK